MHTKIRIRKTLLYILFLPILLLGSFSLASAENYNGAHSVKTCTKQVNNRCIVGTYQSPYVTNYNTSFIAGTFSYTSSMGAVSAEDFAEARSTQLEHPGAGIVLEERLYPKNSGYFCPFTNTDPNQYARSVLQGQIIGEAADCTQARYNSLLTALNNPENLQGGVTSDPAFAAAPGTATSYSRTSTDGQVTTYNFQCARQANNQVTFASCTKAEYERLTSEQRRISSSTVNAGAARAVTEAQAAYDTCVAANGASNQQCIDKKAVLDAATAAAAAGATSPAASSTPPESPCGVTTFFMPACVFYVIQQLIVSILQWTIIPFGNMVLGFSGLIFDYSLYFSLVKFPDLMRSLGADGSDTQSSIYATWVIVRNLFNIIIVFQLLKIAIYKILSPVLNKSGGDLKRLLMSIIIFTLFVNFSFFFTKALIDLSNIAALQFYAGMGGKRGGSGSFEQGGIAIGMARGMGIRGASIFYSDSDPSAGSNIATANGVTLDKDAVQSEGEKSIFGTLMVFVLLLVVSLVLMQGAAIFIGRSVVLIFLLVFSPLMFARNIIGFVNTWSEKWWDMLLEQLFVAPLYLGMLFLALKMAGGGAPGGLTAGIVDAGLVANGGFFGSIAVIAVQAAVMGGLFIACVKLAKDFGGAAAKKSSAWGARAYGAAVGGAGGAVLRRGLGGAADRFSNSQKWKDRAAGTGIGAAASRSLLNIADKGKNSTFDFRNSSALKGVNGAAGKFGLDFKETGTGAKAGFVGERAAADKKRDDKLAARQALLKTDTYGMTPEEKKKAEKADKERQDRSRAAQAITSNTTDAEFEKLRRNEEGLDGDELKYAQEYNKSLDEARKQAQTRLGQIQSGTSTVRSRITGRATGSDIAARGTALGRTDDENKKLKEAEAKKRSTAALAKLLSDSGISKDDQGIDRGAEEIKAELTRRRGVIEHEILAIKSRTTNGTTGSPEDIQKLAELKKKYITHSNAIKKTDSWVKQRDSSTWRTDTPTPPTPPAAA